MEGAVLIYIRLLYREIKKHHKLLITYLFTFYIIYLLCAGILDVLGYFKLNSVVAGVVSNHYELLWWIWVVIPSIVTSASYWHRECTDFILLELTRMKSFKYWFQLKISFVLFVHLVPFTVFGVLSYTIFTDVKIIIILQSLNIGLYTLILTLFFILMSFFISSISTVLMSFIIIHILYVLYFMIRDYSVIFIRDHHFLSLLNQMLIIAVISFIIIILIKIGNPSYLLQRRSERN